jgi:hypothetical protein
MLFFFIVVISWRFFRARKSNCFSRAYLGRLIIIIGMYFIIFNIKINYLPIIFVLSFYHLFGEKKGKHNGALI